MCSHLALVVALAVPAGDARPLPETDALRGDGRQNHLVQHPGGADPRRRRGLVIPRVQPAVLHHRVGKEGVGSQLHYGGIFPCPASIVPGVRKMPETVITTNPPPFQLDIEGIVVAEHYKPKSRILLFNTDSSIVEKSLLS